MSLDLEVLDVEKGVCLKNAELSHFFGSVVQPLEHNLGSVTVVHLNQKGEELRSQSRIRPLSLSLALGIALHCRAAPCAAVRGTHKTRGG
jgi:hypothetical protein